MRINGKWFVAAIVQYPEEICHQRWLGCASVLAEKSSLKPLPLRTCEIILLYRGVPRNFMKLKISRTEGQNTFTAYGDDYVSVNAVRHGSNLIVLPDRLITDWTLADFETLSAADFELLATLDTEIVLLGTGKQLRFPRAELLRPLITAQKGLEVMDVQAACRTYNVLIGEGRKVAAALIFS